MGTSDEGVGIASLARALIATLNESGELECCIAHSKQNARLQEMLINSKAESYLTQLQFAELEIQALELSTVGDGAEIIPALQAKYAAAWQNHLRWMEQEQDRLSDEKQQLINELQGLSGTPTAHVTSAVKELRQSLHCAGAGERHKKTRETKCITPSVESAKAWTPPTFSALPDSCEAGDRFALDKEASNDAGKQFLLRPEQCQLCDTATADSLQNKPNSMPQNIGPQPQRPVRRQGCADASRTRKRTTPRSPPRLITMGTRIAWSPPEM